MSIFVSLFMECVCIYMCCYEHRQGAQSRDGFTRMRASLRDLISVMCERKEGKENKARKSATSSQ